MLVTCTFYGVRHGRATVALQVERERLAVGESFAFAGETYVILSVVAGEGTYAANVAPEQSARARRLPRTHPPRPGLHGGPTKDRTPPPAAETAHAHLDALAGELQRLQHARADELTRLGQLVQQLDDLPLGEATAAPSNTGETSIAANGAGEPPGFPALLQALEERWRRLAARLAQLQAENRQLEANAQAACARLAALEAEGHELRRLRDATPAAPNGSGPPRTPAQEPSAAYTVARLRDRLAREPDDVQTRIELATRYARQGLDEHAIREYQQALARQPACVEALEPLALLLEKLNRAREAAALWERLLGVRGAPDPGPGGGPDPTARGSTGQEAVTPPMQHPRTPWGVRLFARLRGSPPRPAR
jgi:hypothetical protein